MSDFSFSNEESFKQLNFKRNPIKNISCSQIDLDDNELQNQINYELAQKQFRLNKTKTKQKQKNSLQIFDFDSLIQKNRQFCCKCRRSLSIVKSIFIHHYRKYYCVVCFSQYTILKTKQLCQYVQGDTWSHIKFRYQILNCKAVHMQTNQWFSLWSIAEDFALIKGVQKFGITSFEDIRSYLQEIGISKSKNQILDQLQQFQKHLIEEQLEEKQIFKMNKVYKKQSILYQPLKNKPAENNYKKWIKMSKIKKQMLKFLDFNEKRWQFQRNSGSALEIYQIVLAQLDDIQNQLNFQEIKDFNQVKQILLEQYIEKQTNFENTCRFLIESDFLQGKYITIHLDETQKGLQIEQNLTQDFLNQIFQDQISFSIPYTQHKSSQSFISKQEAQINYEQKIINTTQNQISEDLIQDSELKSQDTDSSWICQKKRRKSIQSGLVQIKK